MNRRELVECDYRKAAEKECPWAAVIIKVDSGFMCFENMSDYMTWKNQK